VSAQVVDPALPDRPFRLRADQLNFAYRHSRLQAEQLIVLSARWQLEPGQDPRAVSARTSANLHRRTTSQPYQLPSCGSVFRNPEPQKAGQLIESLGLKGLQIGGAAVSELHANFIVNLGDATAADIEALNQRAVRGDDLLDISAFSCATYARIASRYALTACGSSVGDGYGPKVVAREARTVDSLRGAHVAIPGQGTTAFMVTSMLLGPGSFRATVVPFKEIPARVAAGEFDAGVVIHEGQLTFAEEGLVLVEDLGRWWLSQTGLPLPLGANGVLRSLDERHGPGTMQEVALLLEQSVRYALDHRAESVRYALAFADGMSEELADRFIGMYVNAWTLDYGPTGRLAVRTLLDRAADAGLLPRVEAPEFVAGGAR
jgi:1,4-dihydroxy-6-naphthoate synthase